MGNCMKPVEFITDEDTPGQDLAALDLFKKLMFAEQDLNRLYGAFKEVDTRGRHCVKYTELQIYFHLENTFFNRKVFQLFDTDELHFLQFVCALWNFLSMKTDDLSRYIFEMFSDERTDEINIPILKHLMETIHGKDFMGKKELKNVMIKFENNVAHANADEFAQFTKTYPSFSDPIKRLQLVMRQALLGDKFWSTMANKRYEVPAMRSPVYVLEASLEAMQSAEAAEKKKGARRRSHGNVGKIVPTESDDHYVLSKTPSKPQLKKPDDVVVTVMGSADSKVISKLHTHRSSDGDSPRRHSTGSPSPSPRASPGASPKRSPRGSPKASPRGSPQGSPRGSVSGSPRIRVIGNGVV